MRVAGVDEVGRGPIAGPVISAAVILDVNQPIKGLADSKALTPKKREQLFDVICQQALAFAFGRAEVEEIDKLNILQASLLSMKRAVEALPLSPEHVVVDGPFCPAVAYSTQGIIGGDKTVAEISAASILAKVCRDREMAHLDQLYPGYEFIQHKGYPTARHRALLRQLGPCPIHRRSFAPVREMCEYV